MVTADTKKEIKRVSRRKENNKDTKIPVGAKDASPSFGPLCVLSVCGVGFLRLALWVSWVGGE
jgi:hypothetical protein